MTPVISGVALLPQILQWGAAYDLSCSDVPGAKISEAHAEGILLGKGASLSLRVIETGNQAGVRVPQSQTLADLGARYAGPADACESKIRARAPAPSLSKAAEPVFVGS